jgi:hypothetical protein
MTSPSVWREEFQQVEIESTTRYIGEPGPAGKTGEREWPSSPSPSSPSRLEIRRKKTGAHSFFNSLPARRSGSFAFKRP